MKDSEYDGLKIKDKRTNNDLENSTQKPKHRATRTSIKPEVNSGTSEG